MKLHELGAHRPTEQIARVIEQRLGGRISFDRLTADQAQSMLGRVRALVREHRNSPSRHFSERNPDYLRLMMLEQALAHRLDELDTGIVAVDLQDPKTQAMMKKAELGQQLNPEETKTMAAIAAMKKESKKNKRMVRESEIQTAQVVLAAQDMVDRMQKMMEEISEMQFKDLPALADSVKNDMGVEQSQQFQSQAAAALTELLAAVQAGKTAMESAQGVLTGQAPVVPGDAGMDMGADTGLPPGDDDMAADLDLDANIDLDDQEEEPPVAGLGRERR
jgi:urease gamma subunit